MDLEGDLERYNYDVMIASFSLLLNQPPSVIEKEDYKMLQMLSILKEVERMKTEDEMKKHKNRGGNSALR